MKRTYLAAFLFVVLTTPACSSGDGVTIAKDVVAQDEQSQTDMTAPDERSPLDLPVPDEATPPDVVELVDPVDDFGKPCSANEDCMAGLCVLHMGEYVCSRECVEECPEGFQCQQMSAGGPDLAFACVSLHPAQCLPCGQADDCEPGPGIPSHCAVYPGEGSFCASECSDESPCPAGYYCLQADTVGGEEKNLCLLQLGACPCTQYATEAALSTPCAVENEFGTCTGERVCTDAGLSDCDAATPAEEICNGLDDDCNGETDESICDDGNPCTADTCSPVEGCQYEAIEGGSCDDGDPCTVAEVCVAGECVGTPVTCNDDNACTEDTCDAAGGCHFEPVAAACDDNDPCTVGDHCLDGECVGTAIPCECQVDADCAVLEDGNLCNGTLVCVQNGPLYECQVDPATVVDCPGPEGPNKNCLQAFCDPTDGSCSMVPANSGSPCNDNNKCTYGELCSEGACVQGKQLNCNDGNPCTDDVCQPGIGCVATNNTANCEDGNLCTVNDSCLDGECLPGTPLNCDDANPCTNDVCNPGAGCLHTNNSQPCDDLDPCTLQDSCSGGQCLGTVPKDCDDGNPCTNDLCVPLAGCSHNNNTNPCDDANPCTVADKCLGGLCTPGAPLDCDDANPCTDDACDPEQGCVHGANSAACDDNNSCTTGDHCQAGECIGSGSLDCDDANPCTKDICLPGGGCQHEATPGPCSDDNPCTVNDTCTNGQCQSGSLLDCDDGNPCTDDSCDPATGLCLHVGNQAPCDDGNPCTVTDTCTDKVCTGSGTPDCDDGDVCTTDYCNPAEGCVHLLNSAPCDDGDLCTTGDHCNLGECIGSGTLNCNDGNPCTTDSCTPEAGCVFIPNSDPCDDQNVCTENDACANGWCAGTPVVCNDGNVCTNDYCDPLQGCVNAPVAGLCDDGNACTVDDTCAAGICTGGAPLNCNDGNVCTADSCLPESGCAYENVAGDCTDGSACTVGDTCVDGTCVAGPDAPDCNDANPCTDDACDPELGCVHTNNSANCDDNNECTVGDFCADGACEPGPDALDCDDGNPCTVDTCDPVAGCQHSGGGCNTYSHQFASGPTTPQACSKWTQWRAGLNGNYSSVTIRGTHDMAGVTCTGGSANSICQALKSGGSGSWSCNGRVWRVGSCGNSVEVNANNTMCSCDQNAYTVRPCIDTYLGYTNPNWGAASTDSCNGPSQLLEITCQ